MVLALRIFTAEGVNNFFKNNKLIYNASAVLAGVG